MPKTTEGKQKRVNKIRLPARRAFCTGYILSGYCVAGVKINILNKVQKFHAVGFTSIVAGVAPESVTQTQGVGQLKGFGNFFALPVAFGRTPIDGSANADCAHLPGCFHRSKKGLVVAVGQA